MLRDHASGKDENVYGNGRGSIITKQEKLPRTPVIPAIKKRESPAVIISTRKILSPPHVVVLKKKVASPPLAPAAHKKKDGTPNKFILKKKQTTPIVPTSNKVKMPTTPVTVLQKLASPDVVNLNLFPNKRRESMRERRDSLLQLYRPWGLLHPDDFKHMLGLLSNEQKSELMEVISAEDGHDSAYPQEERTAVAEESMTITAMKTSTLFKSPSLKDGSDFQSLGLKFLKVLRESLTPLKPVSLRNSLEPSTQFEYVGEPIDTSSPPTSIATSDFIPLQEAEVKNLPTASCDEVNEAVTDDVSVFKSSKILVRTPPQSQQAVDSISSATYDDASAIPPFILVVDSNINTSSTCRDQQPCITPILVKHSSSFEERPHICRSPELSVIKEAQSITRASLHPQREEEEKSTGPEMMESSCGLADMVIDNGSKRLSAFNSRLEQVEIVLQLNRAELTAIKAERQAASRELVEEGLRRRRLERSINTLEMQALDARILASRQALYAVNARIELLEEQRKVNRAVIIQATANGQVDIENALSWVPSSLGSIEEIENGQNHVEEVEEVDTERGLDYMQEELVPSQKLEDSQIQALLEYGEPDDYPADHTDYQGGPDSIGVPANELSVLMSVSKSDAGIPLILEMSSFSPLVTDCFHNYADDKQDSSELYNRMSNSGCSSPAETAPPSTLGSQRRPPHTPLVHGYLRFVPLLAPRLLTPYGESRSPGEVKTKRDTPKTRRGIKKRLFIQADKAEEPEKKKTKRVMKIQKSKRAVNRGSTVKKRSDHHDMSHLMKENEVSNIFLKETGDNIAVDLPIYSVIKSPLKKSKQKRTVTNSPVHEVITMPSVTAADKVESDEIRESHIPTSTIVTESTCVVAKVQKPGTATISSSALSRHSDAGFNEFAAASYDGVKRIYPKLKRSGIEARLLRMWGVMTAEERQEWVTPDDHRPAEPECTPSVNEHKTTASSVTKLRSSQEESIKQTKSKLSKKTSSWATTADGLPFIETESKSYTSKAKKEEFVLPTGRSIRETKRSLTEVPNSSLSSSCLSRDTSLKESVSQKLAEYLQSKSSFGIPSILNNSISTINTYSSALTNKTQFMVPKLKVKK